MKNTLTAKEWLIKEGYPVSATEPMISKFMEQYANYRNKELEDKILEFSRQLNTIAKASTYTNILQDIKNQYNTHFNIK